MRGGRRPYIVPWKMTVEDSKPDGYNDEGQQAREGDNGSIPHVSLATVSRKGCGSGADGDVQTVCWGSSASEGSQNMI